MENVAGKYFVETEALYEQPLKAAFLLEKGNHIQVEKAGRPLALIKPIGEDGFDGRNCHDMKLVSAMKFYEMERNILLGKPVLILKAAKPIGMAVSILPREEIEANRNAEARRIKDYMDKKYPCRVNIVGRLELAEAFYRWEYIRDVVEGGGDLLITRGSKPVAYLRPTPKAHIMLGARYGMVEVGSLQGKPETLVDELQRYENVLLTKDKPGEGSSVWDLGAATAAIPPEALTQPEA